jgi:septum formation protein
LTRRIVLASASPRRRELLQQIGLPFEVMPGDVPEHGRPETDPKELARALAREKALAIAEQVPDGLVIGADTIVVVDGRVLGKPVDDADARAMLRLLSGRSHQVITGVAVVDRQEGRTLAVNVDHECTDVLFLPWSEADIDAYVATGEPLDKAGAYAIQGYASVLIAGIRGCYFNVVGLPLATLARMLRALGVPVRPAPLALS